MEAIAGSSASTNVASCKQDGRQGGVHPTSAAAPKHPSAKAYEKSREFKDGQRFRAGIEGRISVLFPRSRA